MRGEPRRIGVEVHETIVDREQAILRIELQIGRHVGEEGGCIRREDVAGERPAQERIVYAEEDVREGSALAEDDLVQRGAGVA